MARTDTKQAAINRGDRLVYEQEFTRGWRWFLASGLHGAPIPNTNPNTAFMEGVNAARAKHDHQPGFHLWEPPGITHKPRKVRVRIEPEGPNDHNGEERDGDDSE